MEFLCKSVTVKPDTCGAGEGDVCGNRTVQNNRISVCVFYSAVPHKKKNPLSVFWQRFLIYDNRKPQSGFSMILGKDAADTGRFGEMDI